MAKSGFQAQQKVDWHVGLIAEALVESFEAIIWCVCRRIETPITVVVVRSKPR